MQYDKKDVPKFQEEVCKKTCIMKGQCIGKYTDPHWFLMCPHYFNWKLEIPESFVAKQIQWEIEHPEEAKAKHDALIEKAKEWKESQKKSKKVIKKTTKRKKKD